MPVIDAHHHLWRYTDEEFGWIPPEWTAIRRDFLPPDLEKTIAAAGVDGVVTVHARQSLEETNWLLGLAKDNAFIRGVVGWVPLVDPNIDAILEALAPHPKLRAVRHLVQIEPDINYTLRADFNRGVSALLRHGLVNDIVILEKHLVPTIQFVDRHPNQIFVLDHIAKPLIKDNIMEPWACLLHELARRPNVYCKISGMVTEADVAAWTPVQLQPYFDNVLSAFGPSRLLFGTDWPVCLAGVTYAGWKATVEALIAPLSAGERRAIMGDNAIRAYRLS